MSTSNDPIRVYKQNDMWHVDYGDGNTQDHPSRETALEAAQPVATSEGRTLDIEDE
jgi:hypothetical protein